MVIRPGQTISEAARRMDELSVGSLVVVDALMSTDVVQVRADEPVAGPAAS